jgi:hypothetical protein
VLREDSSLCVAVTSILSGLTPDSRLTFLNGLQGHITPEAVDGGPIAFVNNGDKIVVDAVKRFVITLPFPITLAHELSDLGQSM